MLEIAGIAFLIVVALAVFALAALLGFVIKVTFKLILLPLTLVGWILKGLLLLLAVVLGLFLAPVFMLILGILAVVVGIPLLLLAGLVSAGWALA